MNVSAQLLRHHYQHCNHTVLQRKYKLTMLLEKFSCLWCLCWWCAVFWWYSFFYNITCASEAHQIEAKTSGSL